MGNPVEHYHDKVNKSRRAHRLAEVFDHLIPEGMHVLDVGTGDGSIAAMVQAKRPDVLMEGLEFQVRHDCAIPVEAFDGISIPRETASVDYVSFLDVLHHTEDVSVLLREAVRVARKGIIIKDHLVSGPFAHATLRFMDRVGNARYAVPLPFNYLKDREWTTLYELLKVEPVASLHSLEMYPWWADWLFGRRLHFFARLEKRDR